MYDIVYELYIVLVYFVNGRGIESPINNSEVRRYATARRVLAALHTIIGRPRLPVWRQNVIQQNLPAPPLWLDDITYSIGQELAAYTTR